MNEQNNDLNTMPTSQPLQTDVPTPVPSANVGQPEPVPAPVIEPTTAPQPVIELAPSAPTPVVEPNIAPSTPPQPMVQQPSAVAPQPVSTTPIASQQIQTTEQPVVSPAPAPVQADIVPSDPINPIANNATISPTMQSVQPTLSPSQSQPENHTNNTNPIPNTGSSTVGFVPNETPLPKKKNKTLLVVIIFAILAVIAGVGIFVIYPMIKKNLTTPKMVYEVAIGDITKQINTTVDDIIHDKALIDISLGIDSNMPTISSFSGYTYGINAGVDSNSNTAQVGLFMKNSTVEYSLYEYLKNGKKYSRYSTDNQLNFLGEMSEEESNEIFSSFKEVLESQKDLSNDDANYLVNKVSELLIASLDEGKLSREETSLTINGKNVKALNNKYVIDNDTADKMVKHIINGLKEDEKAIAILANIMNLSEDEINEKLTYNENNLDDEDDEDDEQTTLIMNLYTDNSLSKSLGFALTDDNGEIKIHYYTLDNYFELGLYSKEEDIETNKDNENKVSVVGTKRDKGTDVVVTVNDKKVVSLFVTENTEDKLSLTYEVFGDEDTNVNGKLNLTIDDNDKRNKTVLDFTMKAGEQYINVSLNVTLDWTSEVANINTGNAVQVSDVEIQNKNQELLKQLSETPIGILLQTISGDVSSTIQDYYEDSYNYIDDNTANDVVNIIPEYSDIPVIIDEDNYTN